MPLIYIWTYLCNLEADAPISNVPLSDKIEVTIEPSLTSQVNLSNIETDTSLSNVLMSENIEDECYADNKIPDPHTKINRGSHVKRYKPNDVNGFDIYINHQTKIIRIFSVSENCKHNIIPHYVVLKVDNIPLDS